MSKHRAPEAEENFAPKKQKICNTTNDLPPTCTTPVDITTSMPGTPTLVSDITISKRSTPLDPAGQPESPLKKQKKFHAVDNTYESVQESAVPKGKGRTKDEGKAQKPPVAQGFIPWKPSIIVPLHNDFWGIKPVSGDSLPHADQPSARDSDAATNPAMWEDRKFRFKRGSRYVKYFGPIEPEHSKFGPNLDQEDLLVLKLIDMRPKSKKDQTPRRTPVIYAYEHGKPKDWNDMQTIKALNDRRAQAIERITVDAPWSRVEREYLAQICRTFPDASIWKITMLHNDRFKGKDFAVSTAFSFISKSSGRTVESVRHEYMTYKLAYENGKAPQGVRHRTDASQEGKTLHISGKMEEIFGKSCPAREREWDENADKEGACEGLRESSDKGKATPSITSNKSTKATKKYSLKKKESIVSMSKQPMLLADDEELLELAGAYDDGKTSLAEFQIAKVLAAPDSPLSEIDDEEMFNLTVACDGVSSVAVKEVVEGVVDGLVDQAVQATNKQNPNQAAMNRDRPIIEETLDTKETTKRIVAVSATKALPQLNPARHIELDEEYDQEEGEA
ncbi:hypothetical protein GQ44DRAFT_733118 [Phaeosphaeriaceae sp. PMI808]|nr:hypothetical protein GQ44DRAFT_733118 [Phaeosphaeriaceae sp. PMI808]